MIIGAELDELPYLRCPQHKHSEQLSQVCLEDTCKYNMLICPLCQLQNHQNHSTAPLRIFLQQHLHNCDQKDDEILLDKLTELDEIQANTKLLLSKAKQSFLDSIYKLQVKITEYFNVLADKLLQANRFKKKEEVRKLLLKVIEKGEIVNCNYVLKMVKMNSKITNKSPHQYYVVSTNAKFTSLQIQIASMVNQKKFGEIGKLFTPIKEPLIRPDYYWSELKGSKMIVQGLVVTQSLNSSNGQRFALMQTDQSICCDISTSVKIRKVKGWIGVGICLKNVIVKAGYKFNYTMPLHGSYLVSSNGYSWSHSNPQYNSVAKSFLFNEGDIIKIEYSVARKQISFRNLKKQVSFKLDVVDSPITDRYVPCVNLCNPGDQVEIINHPQ